MRAERGSTVVQGGNEVERGGVVDESARMADNRVVDEVLMEEGEDRGEQVS